MGCSRESRPEVVYARLEQLFTHGDLAQAHAEARHAIGQFSGRSDEWAWKFRLIDASVLLREGRSDEVLSLLSEKPPGKLAESDIGALRILLQAVAYTSLGQQDKARQALEQAQALSQGDQLALESSDPSLKIKVFNTWGYACLELGDLVRAQELFHKGLDLARIQNYQYQQSSMLLNLGFVGLRQERFDEALDWFESAVKVAQAINARILLEKSEGNVGWADYKLGNYEEALKRFQIAEEEAEALNATPDRMLWLINIGLSLYRLGHLQEAESYYKNALQLAETYQDTDNQIEAQVALAELLLQTGDIDSSVQHTERAFAIAHSSGRNSDEMEAQFLKGLIDIRQQKIDEAMQALGDLDALPALGPSLRWQVEDTMANVYALEGQPKQADRCYRQAIATFETQRQTLKKEESKLPFSSNADQIYDDYIRFLVDNKRTDEALRWLDLDRARTLEEGLGIASSDFNAALKKPQDVRAIAQRLHGTILVYNLAQQESYLWAINASGTHFFKLAPQSEIDFHVRNYQRAILASRDTLSNAYADGIALYKILVEPTQSLIPKDSPVYIIPDGSLTTLNFETLLAPGGGVHYWIDDVVITDASSLKLLAAFHPETHETATKKLLLIGDPVSPDEKFPDLPHAASEVTSVAKHFPTDIEAVFTQKQALPSAYASSNPAQFSYIHFVAHGTSSSTSPLDSAIVLTREPSNADAFKLYARDVIQKPLHADLVTISACYGSGSSVYAGEGIIGLSWAFLRAGAHYVIGSLWEVSDAAAPQLMDRMYGELARGRRPDAALREAKLSLLHSDNVFRKPLYWATFQLYGGT